MPYPEPVIRALLEKITFTVDGLVCAIAQDSETKDILMQAWMNADSIRETLTTGRVCYWSRSRQKLWRKGETSGQHQELREMRLDCDGDCLVLLVKQHGVACHTGRKNCFFHTVSETGLRENAPVIIPPTTLYQSH
jgi:phosphoribosyl-AMP cyclohydrolase